ncbi:MAG: DUF1698 domain-containing protein [Flavobacteriales bacterium]|jgi:hypothetical protein|nr:DUF1698 domain-containing protein [Flavobacteriales bacterium]MCB0757901.1 DUF1698 domain-containing protein [Flavobacteriales bacterium]
MVQRYVLVFYMGNNNGPTSPHNCIFDPMLNNMRFLLPSCLLAVLIQAGCSGTDTTNTPETAPEVVQTIPREDPNDWRAGDSLLTVLGPLEGKVVADMFAGDGYYTWRLLGAGARVLAIDDNPENIAALEARKKSEGIGDDRLLIRLTTPGITGLIPDEVDLALITREYSTLGDRPAWFAQLMQGVKAPHTFYLVNFMPQQTPVGPPLSQRMGYNTVADEITGFGYDDVGIFYKKMPYQYVLFGSIPPELQE